MHNTIVDAKLFQSGDRVAIGASGGKGMLFLIPSRMIALTWFRDSTVLAHCMKVLNDRYNYGLELFLLSIDEGITGYRDDSLEVSSIDQSHLPRNDWWHADRQEKSTAV